MYPRVVRGAAQIPMRKTVNTVLRPSKGGCTMPRLVRSVPKYRLHRGSGQAVVTLHGKDYYLGPWKSAASRVEYDRIIAEHLAANRQPPPEVSDDLTVNELALQYWRFAKGYYVKDGRSTGVTPGIKVALRFLRRLYGRTAATAFGPLALEALQMKMVEAGHSRRYINQNISHIKRMFKWGVRRQLTPVTVYQSLLAVPGLKRGRTIAREPEPIGPVSDDVVDATLPHLPPVVADMVRFQRLVGCRPTELCMIRPCDVDTKAEVWCYVPESHKTEHRGRERRIFIGPKGQDVLRPYLLRGHQSYCFSPTESRRRQCARMRANRKTKVQPSQIDRSKRRPQRTPGDRYCKDAYNRAIRRAVDKANKLREDCSKLPHWHPNQLRHSAATSIRKQYGLEAAQVTLGHARADVTQVYAERDFNLAKRIMREVG